METGRKLLRRKSSLFWRRKKQSAASAEEDEEPDETPASYIGQWARIVSGSLRCSVTCADGHVQMLDPHELDSLSVEELEDKVRTGILDYKTYKKQKVLLQSRCPHCGQAHVDHVLAFVVGPRVKRAEAALLGTIEHYNVGNSTFAIKLMSGSEVMVRQHDLELLSEEGARSEELAKVDPRESKVLRDSMRLLANSPCFASTPLATRLSSATSASRRNEDDDEYIERSSSKEPPPRLLRRQPPDPENAPWEWKMPPQSSPPVHLRRPPPSLRPDDAVLGEASSVTTSLDSLMGREPTPLFPRPSQVQHEVTQRSVWDGAWPDPI
eukprot:5446663-Prymnesium_polylepis.2